jgi:hypothetical protein
MWPLDEWKKKDEESGANSKLVPQAQVNVKSQAQVVVPPQEQVVVPPQAQVVVPPQAQVVVPPQGQVVVPPQAQVVPPPQAQVVPQTASAPLLEDNANKVANAADNATKNAIMQAQIANDAVEEAAQATTVANSNTQKGGGEDDLQQKAEAHVDAANALANAAAQQQNSATALQQAATEQINAANTVIQQTQTAPENQSQSNTGLIDINTVPLKEDDGGNAVSPENAAKIISSEPKTANILEPRGNGSDEEEPEPAMSGGSASSVYSMGSVDNEMMLCMSEVFRTSTDGRNVADVLSDINDSLIELVKILKKKK